MKFQRKWVTPTLGGFFFVLSITGITMFFHLETSLAKLAHEWLGWLLVLFAGAHIALNWGPLKHYFRQPIGKGVLLSTCVLTAALFAINSDNSGGEPPFLAPLQTLSEQPLSDISSLANRPFSDLQSILGQAGYQNVEATSSLATLTDHNMRQSINLLGQIFSQQ